ncbi:hypothetical protein ACJX0J_041620, partial [Zea mays]
MWAVDWMYFLAFTTQIFLLDVPLDQETYGKVLPFMPQDHMLYHQLLEETFIIFQAFALVSIFRKAAIFLVFVKSLMHILGNTAKDGIFISFRWGAVASGTGEFILNLCCIFDQIICTRSECGVEEGRLCMGYDFIVIYSHICQQFIMHIGSLGIICVILIIDGYRFVS